MEADTSKHLLLSRKSFFQCSMRLERHRSVDESSGFTPNAMVEGLEAVTGNFPGEVGLGK